MLTILLLALKLKLPAADVDPSMREVIGTLLWKAGHLAQWPSDNFFLLGAKDALKERVQFSYIKTIGSVRRIASWG